MVGMKAFSIRLPDELHDRIVEAAANEFRSVNQQIEYLLTKAMTDYYPPDVRRLLSETERQEIASPAQPGRKGRGTPPKEGGPKAASIPGRQNGGVLALKSATPPPLPRTAPPAVPPPRESDFFDEDDIPPF